MLSAAVCDDNPVFSRNLQQMLEKENAVGSTALFEDPAALLEAIEQGQTFDVVFMDIDFQQRQAGLAAASEIYEKAPSLQIIYITGYNDLYAQQVMLFEANLTGYITKPVQEEVLHRYLEKAQANKEQQKQDLTISIKGREHSLLLDQIEVLESNRHQVRIQTNTGEYFVYDKLSNIMPKLSRDFIQCHKSYVVNARYIEKFSTEEIMMKNADKGIPVSRAFKKQTRETFFRYINEKARME